MSYGVTRDWFAFGDTNWKPESNSQDGTASNAQAVDSFGDVPCETVFDTAHGYSVEYAVVGPDTGAIVFPANLKGGAVVAYDTNTAIIVTGAELSTSGTDFPRVTVTGELNKGDSTHNTYNWTSVLPTLTATKTAQPIGWATDTNSRATSSSVSFSTSIVKVPDSLGVTCKMDVHGGRAEGSGDLVSCTSIAGATADTANGWALSTPVSTSEENTGYGNGSIAVYQNLTRVTTTTT